MAQVSLSGRARRDLERLPRIYMVAVAAGIDRLAHAPPDGKLLRGDLSGFRSLRIGSYRLVYTFDRRRNTIEVVWIRHRREAYR